MAVFTDKHIVVTGAASGMGRLFTLRFLEQGATVAAWDIDRDGLATLSETVKEKLGVSSGRLQVFVCDLSSRDEIQTTAQATIENLKHVDVVLNNAGIVSGGWIDGLTDEQIERTFAVNTLAPVRVVKSFLPSMIERGSGHFVTVASAGSFIGTPRLADYCASKSAVLAFDEALRLEMKQQNLSISTTVICPFFVDTGMFTGVKSRFSWLLPVLSPEKVVARAIQTIERKKPRLIMPWFVYSIFPLRVLPVSWFDALANFFGITRSMDDFRGRMDRGKMDR